jgi:hypothetical protein
MALSTLPYKAVLNAHRSVGAVGGETDELDVQIKDAANANRGAVLTYSVGRGQDLAAIRSLFNDAIYAQMQADAGGRAALLDAMVGKTVA